MTIMETRFSLLVWVLFGVILVIAASFAVIGAASLGLAPVLGIPFWLVFLLLASIELGAMRRLSHRLQQGKSFAMGLLASYGAVTALGMPAWAAVLGFLVAPYLLVRFLAHRIIRAGKLALPMRFPEAN
jgi:hypothetical protein